jgi:hypothetical protein
LGGSDQLTSPNLCFLGSWCFQKRTKADNTKIQIPQDQGVKKALQGVRKGAGAVPVARHVLISQPHLSFLEILFSRRYGSAGGFFEPHSQKQQQKADRSGSGQTDGAASAGPA